MPTRPRFLGLLAVLTAAGALASCEPPGYQPPHTPDLRVRDPETHYVVTDGGKTLYFETTVINPTDSAMVVTAFAYAADDVAQPPARALYPPRALASMPSDRRYAMGRPDLGQRLVLPAHDSATFAGALPLPQTWADGRAVSTSGFREFTIYLYGEDSKTLSRQQWALQHLRSDTLR